MTRCYRALLLVLLSCCAVACELERAETRRSAITDGEPWTGHPAVGILRGSGHFCTATLVGVKTVLTAAHCIADGASFTFETEGATYDVQRVIPHPSFVYDAQTISPHDIALVVLGTAPTVAPATVNTEAVWVGLDITLVGYGKTGTDSGFLGDKRKAVNVIDQLQAQRFRFSGSDALVGIGGTCQGDSGGPALATPGGAEVVVGVVSSASAECGVYTWDTRVDAYLPWLISASGGDLHDVATPPPSDTSVDSGGTPDLGLPPADASTPSPDFTVAADGSRPPDARVAADSSALWVDSGHNQLSGGGCRIDPSHDSGPLWLVLLLWALRGRRRARR